MAAASSFSAYTVGNLHDDMKDDTVENTYDGLYCPDFTLTRRPVKHTTIRCKGYNTYIQPVLDITRPYDAIDNHIPITEVDDLSGLSHFWRNEKEISLGKYNMFRTIEDALDTYASSMKKTFDVSTNTDIRTYTVPIIGYLDNRSTFDSTFGTDSKYFKAKTNSFNNRRSSNVSDGGPRERVIIINGDTYSIRKIYKRSGCKYVALNIPSYYNGNFSHHLGANEQTFRVLKTTPSKMSIVITLPKEAELSGLSIHPEDMHFEAIHSTTIRCHGNCTKNKHCISCLKNDPGFLITFKMMIRSSLTDGQWISLGTFSGNSSMYESSRISFDTILVKEIKIVPISYHKSFDKVSLTPIGPSISSTSTSDETYVKYILYTPRDGKYVKDFDKVIDNYAKTRTFCNCSICTGYRTGKGTYKEKCNFMRNAIDM